MGGVDRCFLRGRGQNMLPALRRLSVACIGPVIPGGLLPSIARVRFTGQRNYSSEPSSCQLAFACKVFLASFSCGSKFLLSFGFYFFSTASQHIERGDKTYGAMETFIVVVIDKIFHYTLCVFQKKWRFRPYTLIFNF